MPTRIQIRDKTAHLLEPKLRDLLRIISGEGPALHWAILEFEAVGNLSPGPHVGEINEIIKRSPSGFLLDWGHLVTIADKLLQAINATFVGCRTAESLPGVHDSDIYAKSEIVIEVVDSSWWEVYARDDRVVQRFIDAFHEVVIVDRREK